TGMASSSAGKILRISHENAGSSTSVVNNTRATTKKIMPLNRTIACVSRSEYSTTKKISVTSRMSRTLNQLRRWNMKRMLLRKFAILERVVYRGQHASDNSKLKPENLACTSLQKFNNL